MGGKRLASTMSDSHQPIIETGYRLSAKSKRFYRVIQPLGKGGNSTVYLVQTSEGPFRGVLFALKLFHNVDDPVRLQRFDIESIFLQKCDHPAIMRIYDTGVYMHSEGDVHTELPFAVVEYLPKTLHDAMRVNMSVVEKLSLSLQLLSGLAYLASHNAAHRDIKPQNIFVRGRSAVIGDFGLLKLFTGDNKEDSEVALKSDGPRMPRYFKTPDLVSYAFHGATLTPKTDVFQLGLVLAQLFTGTNPLIYNKDFRAPITLTPLKEIPGSQGKTIEWLIQKMLEQDPEKRPTAESILDGWEGVFRETVRICHQLEGAIFI